LIALLQRRTHDHIIDFGGIDSGAHDRSFNKTQAQTLGGPAIAEDEFAFGASICRMSGAMTQARLQQS